MSVYALRKLILPLICIVLCEKVHTEKESLFLRSIKNKYFVDKSLLIKEIIFGNPSKIIIAPSGFGKSTNLAMIKHFFEIEVTENGVPIEKELTSNYKLFTENNLKICNNKQLFSNYFGKYPTISIDYSVLSFIENYEDFLTKYLQIISNTFSTHTYLLKNKTLWIDKSEINLFQRFCDNKASQENISVSFKWLSELLHKHFNEKPLLLIDEYDALVKSFIFKENKDMIRISKLLRETEENLLTFNNSFGTLMTGELRLFRGDNVSYFVNSGNSKLSPFYGITEDELKKLLEQEENYKEKFIEIKNMTDHYYGGYLYFHNKQTIKLYMTGSVVLYLLTNSQNNTNIIKSEYMKGLRKLSRVKGLAEWLHVLLSEKKVLHTHVELSQPIFHRDHISLLRIVMNRGKTEKTTITSVLFLTLLYYLGFLTPVDKNLRWFKIPNKSALDELQRLVNEKPDSIFNQNVYKEIFEQKSTSGTMYNESSVSQAASKSKPTHFMENFLDVLKSKCIGGNTKISSTDEIKKKIAKWFMEEHLPF